MAELVDIDLDALAPVAKRVKLGGKIYKLPGDMPLQLFLRIQGFEQRVEKGESENTLLSELQDELLALFQHYQPALKKLPDIGVLGLLGSLGHIYGGGQMGEALAKTPTSPPRKRTPSSTGRRSRAT